MSVLDRCGKLLAWQQPEFAQANDRFAPGSLLIYADPNPPDKALSPLRGPRDGGIDEIALIVDGGYVVGVFTCAPNLPILLHLVAQDFLID